MSRRFPFLASLRLGLAVALGASAPSPEVQAAPRSAPSRPAAAGTVKIKGIDYIDTADLARRFGLKRTWLVARKQLVLEARGATRLVLQTDSREAQFNGVRLYLGDPAVPHKRSLFVSRTDAVALLTPLLRPGYGVVDPKPPRLIVLDAGHGGSDKGMQNERLKIVEKTFALDVVQRLKTLLEGAGYRVLLTRRDDTFVPLPERAEIANRAGADLFISVHFNAHPQRQINGTETYALTPAGQPSTGNTRGAGGDYSALPGNRFDAWNTLLAHRVHRQLIGDLQLSDRGLKRMRLAVLKTLNCPGVLVESAFLSNDAEATKVVAPAFRQKIAQSIAAGVADYARAVQSLQPAK